ncbi:MAG: hypothetical protein ABH845_02285, partial [Candidatus Omnitrophota bacterium]
IMLILCPICHEDVPLRPVALERHLDVEPHVIDLICEIHPEWMENSHPGPKALAFYRTMLSRTKLFKQKAA